MSDVIVKPPLGLMPRFIHDEKRMHEILDACNRFIQASRPVPIEWIEELNELMVKYQDRVKHK